MVGSGGTLLNISNASNLSLTGDTLGNTASFVTYSNLSQVSNASVTGNTFNGALQMFYSTKSTVSNNIFLNPDSTDEEPYLLGFLFGSGNEAIGNQINGTQAGWFKGVDDGIILQDESGDTISNNVIKNNWDCGIEFTGNIKNTLITNNTISVYDTAAIGGWYYMSMTGSTISNNTANSLTGQVMLLFFRSYGLRAAGYDPLGTFPADTGVYFQNNIFSGNVANNLASPGTGLETVMELYNYLAYTTAQPQGGGTPIANNQFHISNNTFTGNNFGAGVNGPFFDPPASPTPLPADYVVDGGGNTCAAGTGTPVTCTP
jgi:parallel beta-helix repeat protein